MHDSVLERIEVAYESERYIEVCWLCYACFESRVNRVLEKICSGCSKEQDTTKRHIGIVTKLECYVRLIKSKYPPLQKEDLQLIRTVKRWCKERNELIHGMVSLKVYNDADKKFENLAERGVALVKRMYGFSADVRDYFYRAEAIPPFDDKVVRTCRLKYRCK